MVQIANGDFDARVSARKREILRAASWEFRARGFHATGMRDIARALGMTVGNLYYYFRNKEELLAFCQEDALTRLLALGQWVNGQSLRADARLALLIQGHVLCLNTKTPGSLAHLEVEELGVRWRPQIVAKRGRYERLLRRILREGMTSGVFRTTDPKVAGLAILGALNWTVKWFRPEGNHNASAIGRSFADLLVRGILAPGIAFQVPTVEIPSFDFPSPKAEKHG